MLELADQHLVPGFEEGCAPTLSDEVDALGRSAHKDDLARVGGVQKRPHLLASLLEQLGRAGAQSINAAMYIGIIGAVEIRDPVDHRAGFLRAGAAVEKHETGVAREDRKFALQHLRVKPPPFPSPARGGGKGGGSGMDTPQTRRPHAYSSNVARCRTRRACRYSRKGVCSTSSTASRAKASIRIRRASSLGMPRARR